MRVLNFGSCNIDYVYTVPHFVKPGETLSATERNCFPGGKGLNQSLAIARSGAEVYHAGCVGKDGLFLKTILDESNVNTKYLKILDAATGHAIIQVDRNGENSIILHGGANDMIDKDYIDHVLSKFGEGDIIVLQNEISHIDYIIQQAHVKKMRIVLNPSPFHPALAKIDLNKLFLLICNQVEATEFSGEDIPEKICVYFRKTYPNLKVVLTLGAKGSVYFDKDTQVFCPSFCVKVKDTTSAGDTYTGYFISGILRNLDIEKTLKLATAAAALAVSKNGAASSIPYQAEVKQALQTLKPNNLKNFDIENKKTTIISYINDHLSDASLETLSKTLGYSKAYTTVWIKKHMETSFSALLKTCRCEKAAYLLRETDTPMEEIIKLSGYENGSFLRKIFKEIYGKGLLEYRKFYRNADK